MGVCERSLKLISHVPVVDTTESVAKDKRSSPDFVCTRDGDGSLNATHVFAVFVGAQVPQEMIGAQREAKSVNVTVRTEQLTNCFNGFCYRFDFRKVDDLEVIDATLRIRANWVNHDAVVALGDGLLSRGTNMMVFQ